MTILNAASRRRGVILYLLAVFFFALNDALGKWLVADYTVGELLALRASARLSCSRRWSGGSRFR